MRVLLTSQFGHGHWRPLAGLAGVLLEAGHDVAFVSTPATCGALRGHGFECFPAGVDDFGGVEPERDGDGAGRVDPAEAVWRHVFAGRRVHEMLPEMLAAARAWRPDLIVREISEFSGMLVADLTETPFATLQISAWRPELLRAVAGQLNAHRERLGLPAVADSDHFYGRALLPPDPPSYRMPGRPHPLATYPMHLPTFDAASIDGDGFELPERSTRPRVYATLGTAYNQRPDLFALILAAAGELDVELIMTTGMEPAAQGLSPATDNVVLRDYIPVSAVLPNCDLVISHGGFGTFQAALRHGLPQVLLPLAADQPDNARQCVFHGAGVALWDGERSLASLREAVQTVLAEPGYRRRAEQWRQAIDALPSPAATVAVLEKLAGCG